MLSSLNHLVIPAPYQVRGKHQAEFRRFLEMDSYGLLLAQE